MAKHTKYYLVVIDGKSSYRKIESDLAFSTKEGKDWIKEKNPTATSITPIANSKAEGFLKLNMTET